MGNFSVSVFLALLTLVLVLPGQVSGAAVKDAIEQQYKQDKDICSVVKKSIASGMNTQEVTKVAIQLGHDACLVVRCAIEAKAPPEQVVTGAVEAGATPDVVSKCALDAGAEPQDIAGALGYVPVAPVDLNIPRSDIGGGTLSPYIP
jgi:hypothetical protein